MTPILFPAKTPQLQGVFMRSHPARLAIVLLLCAGFTWLVVASHHDAAAKSVTPEFYFHHDHVIGTSLDVWMTAPDEAGAEQAEHAILGEIERLRKIFSLYDSESELSRLNGTRQPMAVSSELIDVLRHYEIWQGRSGGAFNGQLGELVRIWKEAEKKQEEPDDALLSEIVHRIHLRGWQIDEAAGTVTRLTDQPLNLNAIAKGYIIQKAAAAARAKVPSLQGLLLNLGGDMAIWGRDDAGRAGFLIGVQNPHQPEDNAPPLARIRVDKRAVATSGGYERYYSIGGKKYSHLFDPRTGRSADGAASATVIAGDNITANALATTLCVLTPASPQPRLHRAGASGEKRRQEGREKSGKEGREARRQKTGGVGGRLSSQLHADDSDGIGQQISQTVRRGLDRKHRGQAGADHHGVGQQPALDIDLAAMVEDRQDRRRPGQGRHARHPLPRQVYRDLGRQG
jgi:thiamine biosynthesis lipoprotein ApbE